MERYELPDGWIWSTLGECCDVNQRDPALKAISSDTTVSFVPMAAVDAEQGVIANPVDRLYGEVRKGFTPFSDGDVIFAKITPSMENGKAAIASSLTNGFGFGSTEFHVMRPNETVIADWIFHFIRQQSFRDEAKASFTGTAGQLRVPEKFLLNADIPLAPVPEQERIIVKIERLFEQSRTARIALTRVPELMSQFRRAVLASAFRGELVEPHPNDEPATSLLERVHLELRQKRENGLIAKGKDPSRDEFKEFKPSDSAELPPIPERWVWTTLPELGELARGKSKHRPRDEKKLYGGPYPFIQTGDIARANGLVTSYSQTYSEIGLAQSRLWPKGTLCITIAANIADTALLDFDACFPDSVVGFIANDKAVDVRFVEFFIRTIKDNLEQFAPATAQKNINLNILQNVAVPLPPLTEQKRIVAKIEALFAQANIIEQAASVSLRRAEQLDQSILARAFRGELG
jgi:type I restriction enzyme, S subunit